MPRLEPGKPITVQQGGRVITGYLKSTYGGGEVGHATMSFDVSRLNALALGGPLVEYEDLELTIQITDEKQTRGEFLRKLADEIKPSDMTFTDINRAIRPGPMRSHFYTPESEQNNMEKFNASVIGNKSDRTVDIVIEDMSGRFLVPKYNTDDAPSDAPQYDRVERALGESVPVFMTLPQELFAAIKQAD
jgi:hypothetical protein